MALISPLDAHYTVYKLTDPEGKVYIGCTGQRVEKRWKKGSNYRKQKPIQDAIEKYGWDAFEKKILCEKLTKEGAEKLEKWFIAFYDSSDPEKGYNRMLGGLGKGQRMSEASRQKCRESTDESYARDPDYRRRVSEGVLRAYENDPAYFQRLREAARMRYQREPERREQARRQMREDLSHPENRAFANCDKHPKPVRCVETGEIFSSQQAAERATGLSSLHKVFSGNRKTCGGCHWEHYTA